MRLADFPRVPLLFGPSPVHPLPRLSQALGGGVEIWAKREDCNSPAASRAWSSAVSMPSLAKWKVVPPGRSQGSRHSCGPPPRGRVPDDVAGRAHRTNMPQANEAANSVIAAHARPMIWVRASPRATAGASSANSVAA